MELTAYLLMAAGAYVALITRERVILYGWFALYVVYSLVARIALPTVDMVVYSRALAVWPPLLTFYNFREPVVWFGGALLHSLLSDRVATFLAVDIITAVSVLRSMKALDDGSGRMTFLAPTVIASYVFLLGQQNVWRQHIAFVILLWAIASRSRHQRRAILLFVLAFLTHNATAMFAGYWFDVGRTRGRRYGPLITAAGVIALAVLFPSLRKSFTVTGLRTEYLYVFLAVVLTLLVLYTSSGRLYAARSAALINFAAFLPAVAVLASAQFERIAMMFLILTLIELYRNRACLRLGDAEVKHGVYAILVLPVLMFPSALRLLLI